MTSDTEPHPPAHGAAAIVEIASNLSEMEMLLLTDQVSGWGSWMWSVSNDLCAKGLMTRVSDTNIQTNELGNRVRAHISQAKGE